MAKNSVADWDTTAANNTDVGGISIAGTAPPSNIDDGIREIMAQIATWDPTLDKKPLLSVKSGNYTALAADDNATLRFGVAATLSLTAAATLGDNWRVKVAAKGGDVLVDPNGSELIDGVGSFLLPSGSTVTIQCLSGAFFTDFDYSRVGTTVYAAGLAAPVGTLLQNGAAVSRTTYARLFKYLVTDSAFSVVNFTADNTTNIFTSTGHGFLGGERLRLTTNSSLPSPLATGTDYFVIYISANTFYLATSQENAASGNNIDITNNGVGTHSYQRSLWGLGDGSTTFNLPNLVNFHVRSYGAARNVGTYQADAVKAHTHTGVPTFAIAGASGGAVAVADSGTTSTGSTGGTENTVKNMALTPCIYY